MWSMMEEKREKSCPGGFKEDGWHSVRSRRRGREEKKAVSQVRGGAECLGSAGYRSRTSMLVSFSNKHGEGKRERKKNETQSIQRTREEG